MATNNQKDPLTEAVVGKKPKITAEQVEGILTSGDLTGADGRARATVEEAEFRRVQIHRLLLRGVPPKTIAEHLKISIHTVYSDKKIINSKLRNEIQEMDYPLYIGQSVAFYDEVRNIALRMATDTQEKSSLAKISALQQAIKAEDSKNNFLGKLGLYKAVNPSDPFNNIRTGKTAQQSDGTDIESFLALASMASKGTVELSFDNSRTSKDIIDGEAEEVVDD